MSENLCKLPAGTVLDRYTIEKTLSSGGFSIVYLAVDQTTQLFVVIKEYFPLKIAHREQNNRVVITNEDQIDRFKEGWKLFIHEANALRKLNHPTIVNVSNFFEANNTLYMVMDYKPGENLQSYIRKHNGNLSEIFLLTIFPPLLDGLRLVHEAGMLHLDIKPGNIHIQPGGDPILLDFGGVHRMQMSRQFQPRSVITEGFSPIEQYERNGYIGPWTDIYAIGATIRSCIEGTSPPSAQKRQEKDRLKPAIVAFKRKYSRSFLIALDWAMELDPTLRPQCVDDMLAAFDQCMLEAATRANSNVFTRLVGNLRWTK